MRRVDMIWLPLGGVTFELDLNRQGGSPHRGEERKPRRGSQTEQTHRCMKGLEER
jgi:hypothetical protein